MVEGEYAVAEVDEFSDFVFVKVVDAQTPTPILMFAIIAIAVLLLVGIVFIARR